MKTFSTEKHNIPEGATHYRDETSRDSFAWFCFYPTPKLTIDGSSIYGMDIAMSGENLNSLKPIPRTNIETPEEKEVEWVNGDFAIYEGSTVMVIAYHPKHPVIVVETSTEEYINVGICDLSKPETEAERVEREREELRSNIERLLEDRINFNNSALPKTISKIIYDAGYRKES